MDHGGVVGYRLLPPYQDAPEAVHPANRPLHRPASGAIAGNLLQQHALGITRHNVGDVAVAPHLPVYVVKVIALVEPESLFDVFGGQRAVRRNAIQRLLQQLEVHAVGARDGDAQDYPTAVHQEAAFRPALAAIGWVRPRLFPPQAAPSSSRRPSPGTPTESAAVRRTPAAPAPKAARTRPPWPILGSGDAPSYWNRSPSPATHSTGSRCAARRRWRPWRGDLRPVGDDSPADAAVGVARAAGCAPRGHRACPSTGAPAPRSSDSLRPSRPSLSGLTSSMLNSSA